jgi:hypothetical protein
MDLATRTMKLPSLFTWPHPHDGQSYADSQRCLPRSAMIWGLVVAVSAYGSARAQAVNPLTITTANRNYPGIMFGGWGPHLRGLMRSSSDHLWFMSDAGPDAQHNETLVYHCFDGTAWNEAARLKHIPGVQQNVASIMSRDTIFSYGISIQEPRYIEECKFDTKHRKSTCAPIEIAGQKLVLQPVSNYVGAAVSPSGQKVVWWTMVGANGGEGKWSYIFEHDGSWVGPVVSPLKRFNDFAYVFASFSTDNRISVAGQLYAGAYPQGSYGLGCAEFTLGERLDFKSNLHAFSSNSSESGQSASDICVIDDTTHVIAETHHGTLAYYCRPSGKTWADCDVPLCVLSDVHRARFSETAAELRLICGSASGSGISERRVTTNIADRPVDWTHVAPHQVIGIGRDFAAPSAIFVESRSYQTEPVKGFHVSLAGHYPGADSRIESLDIPQN